MHETRKSLYLGMVVGVLLSGIVVLAAFLYFDGPALIDSAFATNRKPERPSTCDNLLEHRDHALIVDFARLANARNPAGAPDIVIAGATDGELCYRALEFFDAPDGTSPLTACLAGAPSSADARRCLAQY
jgi:hypothetical protein